MKKIIEKKSLVGCFHAGEFFRILHKLHQMITVLHMTLEIVNSRIEDVLETPSFEEVERNYSGNFSKSKLSI